MAEQKLFYYRGFPLLRQGNKIFYGCGGDDYATVLTVMDTKPLADREVPNKIMVQLIPNSGDMSKGGRKGDFYGLYEALDTAYIWLTDALFN